MGPNNLGGVTCPFLLLFSASKEIIYKNVTLSRRSLFIIFLYMYYIIIIFYKTFMLISSIKFNVDSTTSIRF